MLTSKHPRPHKTDSGTIENNPRPGASLSASRVEPEAISSKQRNRVSQGRHVGRSEEDRREGKRGGNGRESRRGVRVRKERGEGERGVSEWRSMESERKREIRREGISMWHWQGGMTCVEGQNPREQEDKEQREDNKMGWKHQREMTMEENTYIEKPSIPNLHLFQSSHLLQLFLGPQYLSLDPPTLPIHLRKEAYPEELG
jgi:hypothetical protein